MTRRRGGRFISIYFVQNLNLTSKHNIFGNMAYSSFSVTLTEGKITVIIETLFWREKERDTRIIVPFPLPG